MAEPTAAVLEFFDDDRRLVERRPITADQLEQLIQDYRVRGVPAPQIAHDLLTLARHAPRIDAVLPQWDLPRWPDWLGPRPDGVAAPEPAVPQRPVVRWIP